MRHQFKSECPCGDYEFTIVYYTDNGKASEFYCPFCGHLIDNDEPPVGDETEEDED